MEALAKVSTKGQVVIPAELRKRHHLEPGASVHVYEYGELICLAPVVADPVEEAWGTLRDGPSGLPTNCWRCARRTSPVNSLLFDSFALLRFFQGEAGGEKVRALLAEAESRKISCLINAINVGEIIYLTQRRFGEEKKLEIFIHIRRMGLHILPCPNDLIFRAAELKARYPYPTPTHCPCFGHRAPGRPRDR